MYQFKLKTLLNQKSNEDKRGNNIKCSAVICHFNCFMQTQNNGTFVSFVNDDCNYHLNIYISEYFVSRLDTINLDSSNDISTFKFEEFKIFTLNNTGDYYTCIRTEDILNYKVFIKNLHLEVKKKTNTVEYNISLWENNVFFWSTNFHMKALLLFK